MADRRFLIKTVLAGMGAAVGANRVAAQDPAAGTISVFIGASSSMDFTGRAIAEHLRQKLDRSVVPVLKLGAGQRVAMGEVRRAAPDGRSIVFVTTGPFAIYPHVYSKLDYDPDADFTPIIGFSKFDVALAVPPDSGIRSVAELVDWARKQPPDTVYASAPGNGSFSHFVGMALAQAAGLKLAHVAYKDSGAGMIDLSGGRIPILITGLSGFIPMHRQGKLRVLAVSGATRSPLLPDVPTLKESGINVSASTNTGVFGPAKMPPDLVNRLYEAILPMTKDAALIARLREMGVEMAPRTGVELRAEIQRERAYFGRLARDAGLKPQDG